MGAVRPLPRSTAASENVSISGIAAFVAELDRIGNTHGYLLLRHGKVIAEGDWAPYSAGMPHTMFSVSKSFTSTAVGLAIAEGLLTLDDRVVELLPDLAPAAPSPHLAAMTVRHLLTMSTGHEIEPTEYMRSEPDWGRAFFEPEVEAEPGSVFLYNSGASYILAIIVTRLTGERLLDYLRPRVLEPLGITDATWEQSPQGIDAGGFGMHLRLEDMASFGELLRRRGEWNGKQLVPAAWIDEATSGLVDSRKPDSAPDWAVGYGYQFWRGRHDTYRADGAFGQFIVIFPELDATLVMTSGLPDGQPVLEAAWNLLIPAFDAGADEAVIPPLSLPVVSGAGAGEGFRALFDDGPVKQLALEGSTLTIADEAGSHRLDVGWGAWASGTTSYAFGDGSPVAASAAWTDAQTWVAQLWFTVTPFGRRIEVRFDGDEVALDITANVAMGPTDIAHQVGRRG